MRRYTVSRRVLFHKKRKLIISKLMMEVDTIVTTVFKGRSGDNELSQRVTEQLQNLAAKLSATGNNGVSTRKSIFERVVHAKRGFDWESFKHLLDPVSNFQKSSEVSTKLREKGNELYRQKFVEPALRAYSLAVVFAPIGSEQLSNAYANRSAVLLQKGMVNDALGDIQRALTNERHCSDGLRKTLEERRRKCESLRDKENRKSSRMGNEELNDMIDKLFIIQEPNPTMPNAESFVKMEYTPEKGRHLIVTSNVKAGTVLMVDKPFVSILTKLLKWEMNHCHNCSKPISAGIPCNMCTFVVFCCDYCRKRACSDETGKHRYEHNYLPLLHALRAPYSDIKSLRILAQIGPTELYRMFQRPKVYQDGNKSHVLGYNEQGIYDVYSYLPTYRLISHEAGDSSNIASIKNALKALFLKEILKQYSNFFDVLSLKASDREKIEDFAAALLLRHLENIKYNAFSLSKQAEESQKSISYAAALFPLISLCNHSCDPNCAPVKQSEHLITSLIALKSLKAGDELFITYKPLYTFMDTPERQKFLEENYLFKCKCQPCEENWGPANVQVNENAEVNTSLVLETSKCESCNAPENQKRKQCLQCAVKDVNKAKGIQKLGGIIFECHDFLEQEKWTKCLQRLPKIVDYFGRNGFNSYFPLYHVALDLYKRALMSSVAHL